jgi:serine/threonine protein kinase
MIFNTLGAPQKDDIKFLPNEQKDYINLLQKIAPTQSNNVFNDKFDHIKPLQKEILRQSLEFNPNNRLSASELLKSKCFDKIRIPGVEEAAPSKITLTYLD